MTTYTDAVAEARQLVKRSEADQWRLAELTWQQVEAGKTRKQWAEDVGVHSNTTERWYQVWHRFGHLEVDQRPTYSEAWNEVIGRVDGKYEQASIKQLPPERKADIARELLAEPEVAEQVAEVIENTVAGSAAAVARVNQEAERRRPAPPKHEAERSALSAAASLTALESVAARLHDVTTEVVADVLDGKASPELLAAPIQSIQIDLKRLRYAAESSGSVDAALAEILNGDQS